MSTLILGNCLCLIGSIIMVIIGLVKHNKKVLQFQCLQFFFFSFGNLVLGGISGFISDFLMIFRNLLSIRFKLNLAVKLAFIIVQITLTVFFNEGGYIIWLPTIATCIFTLLVDTNNKILMKLLLILGQSMWAIYDFSIQNYITIPFDIMTIISNTMGIIMITKKAPQMDSEVPSNE